MNYLFLLLVYVKHILISRSLFRKYNELGYCQNSKRIEQILHTNHRNYQGYQKY